MENVKPNDIWNKDSVKVEGLICSCHGTDFNTSRLGPAYRCIVCHRIYVNKEVV